MTPPQPAVVTLGETLALFAQSGTGVPRSGAAFELRVGGAESNVAIALSRLGVATCWMGRVGNDAFGDEVVRALRGEDVDVRVHRDPHRPTGLMVKQRRTALHQRIAYYRAGSAGSALDVHDLDTSAIRTARVLHVTGITLAISATAAAAVAHAVDIARSAGVLVSFDVNHRPQLWSASTAAEAVTRLIPLADVVFASLDEAALALGAVDEVPHMARQLAAMGPREVVLKLGADGAFASAGPAEEHLPAVPVPVIDTVGAGDAFVAGYLAGLISELPLRERGHLACAVGAFACTSEGDWEGSPTRAELELLQTADPVTR